MAEPSSLLVESYPASGWASSTRQFLYYKPSLAPRPLGESVSLISLPKYRDEKLTILCRCLRPVVNTQLWHLPRLLDRLRILLPYEQLRLAGPGYSAMCMYPANDGNLIAHPGDAEVAGISRPAG